MTRRFVMVRKSEAVPAFEEALENHGSNRLEWVNHLRLRGFRFTLLSQSWLYHLRHKPVKTSLAADKKQEVNMKILQILGYERNQKYAGQWRLPLCSGEENYPNPGMTVEKYLNQLQLEDMRKKSKAYQEEQKIMEKFARKRKNRRQRQQQQQKQQQ